MFDYLNSIMDALRLVGGDQIKMPERYDVDEDDLRKFQIDFIFAIFLSLEYLFS